MKSQIAGIHPFGVMVAMTMILCGVGCGSDTDTVESGIGGEAGTAGEAGTGGQAGTAGDTGTGGIGESTFNQIGGQHPRDQMPNPTADEIASNRTANHRMTLELHRGATIQGTNAMLSAYSVRSAFGLLYPGAVGDTAREISDIIGFDEDPERALRALNSVDQALASRERPEDERAELDPVILRTANAFWSRIGEEWNDDYLRLISEQLGASIYEVDFFADPNGSRDVINGWVEETTQDRIKNLLPEYSITPETLTVMTNAVYFKAPWMTPFEESNTANEPFSLLDGTELSVPTLRGVHSGRRADGEDWIAAELPFRGGELAMVFIVPDEGEFQDFEDMLTVDFLAELDDQLNSAELDIRLPKFEFETAASLKDTLTEMNMTTPFSPSADFSGMRDSGGMTVTGVFHKTFIAIEEGGAEAAAATAIVAGVTSVPPPPVLVQIDRPFIFGIRDLQTGIYLFFGRVTDPTE